jgi:hypothetical protein
VEGVPDPSTQINVDPCGSGSRSTTPPGTRTLTASGSVIHNYESCSRSRRPLYYRSTAQIISLKANRRQEEKKLKAAHATLRRCKFFSRIQR